MTRFVVPVFACLLMPYLLACNQREPQTGKDLIEASIKFHDPTNHWPVLKASFVFNDIRPKSEARPANLFLNNPKGDLCLMRVQDGVEVTRHIVDNKSSYEIGGNTTYPSEAIEKYALNDARSLMLRNYYLYLWGLPMKLRDEGTIIGSEIYLRDFNHQETKAVKVTYDAAVGGDTWYFYFNPTSYEMVGYQFFHNEEKGDGEYIILNGISIYNGVKFPKERSWFTNPDSTLLGTDYLVTIDSLQHKH